LGALLSRFKCAAVGGGHAPGHLLRRGCRWSRNLLAMIIT
jgi:hypothetical protein